MVLDPLYDNRVSESLKYDGGVHLGLYSKILTAGLRFLRPGLMV